jgi:hypothetical protein
MLDQYFTLLLDLIHIYIPGDGYVFGARVECRCVAEGDGTQIVLTSRHWSSRQVLHIEVLQQLL